MAARDVTRVSTSVGISFLEEMRVLIFDMRWMILFCVVLIIVDLKFGIENAQARGEAIRMSRAGRRTINKFIDYMCWLLFAGVLGEAIGTPFGFDRIVVADTVLILACVSEIDSIAQNYCEARGLEKFSLSKFFVSVVKKKNKDIGDALDETLNKDKKE